MAVFVKGNADEAEVQDAVKIILAAFLEQSFQDAEKLFRKLITGTGQGFKARAGQQKQQETSLQVKCCCWPSQHVPSMLGSSQAGQVKPTLQCGARGPPALGAISSGIIPW